MTGRILCFYEGVDLVDHYDTSTGPPAGPDVARGYNLDGNLTGKGGLTLVYNGENRLIAA